MLRWFAKLSIALKLNLLLFAMTFAVIAVATLWVSSDVHRQLEQRAVHDLQKTNALVVSVFTAYERSLTADIERSARLFAASFDGPLELVKTGGAAQLMASGKPVSEQTERLDAFSARSATVATVFARQGEQFVRVLTSVKKSDGARATGTLLAADHPAGALILAGKSFTGKARLFGKDYITHYSPALDARGQVVGIFFVGIDMSAGLQALKKEIVAIRIGDTGYSFGIDAGVDKGVLTVHPTLEGQNLLETKDSDGRLFIREMLDGDSGVVRYRWADTNQAPREKIAAHTRFAAWNWVVVSSAYVDEFTQAANAVIRAIVIMALAILVAVALVCTGCVRRWITRPLHQVVVEIDRLASGDLTLAVEAQEGRDELGRMRQSLSGMAQALKKTIADAHGASHMMLDQAHEMVSVAEQVASSSLAQSDSASGMAASVEQMSVSISQVAQHARDAEKMSSASGQTATHGGAVIGQAASSMEQVAQTVRQASTTIGELSVQSQNISSVVAMIRAIADQTNLLALNAAIEAARAGEQGRGFAVVADEVRKLAERTTVSTHSIGEMIDSIQAGSDQASAHMKEAVSQVEQGSALAEQARRATEEIHHSSCEVIAAVSNISSAISEQNTATQTIAQGIEGIAQKAEANHAATRSSARSAQEMRDVALALEKNLSFFRVA